MISIITVVYNGEKYIKNTIESVLSQHFKNVEYIIVDGRSTDGTIEIIKSYGKGITQWISEPDEGIYDAMNKGLDLASGDWIVFMNCGDRFASDQVLDVFEKETFDEDILYGDAVVLYPSFQTRFEKVPLHQMWKRMPFCHQATFVRASLMKTFKFNTSYSLSSDFDFLYRAFIAGKRFGYLNRVICYFDYTEGESKKNAFKSLSERKQIVLSKGFSLYRWAYFSIEEIYLYISSLFKKIVGQRLTAWITRLLRT